MKKHGPREYTDKTVRHFKPLHSAWLPCLILSLAAALLYAPAISYDLVGLDDNHLVIANSRYLEDPGNIGKAFRTDVFWKSPGTYYRPLLNLSLMLDRWWGKGKLYAYHAGNIVLHLLACLLLYAGLGILGYRRELRLAASLLAAVHPVLAQAVAWIPGRNDTLLTVFILSSFAFFLTYIKSRKSPWLLAHALFFALALFTKETAVIFPLLLLIYLVLFPQKAGAPSPWIKTAMAWMFPIVLWFLLRQAIADKGAGPADIYLGGFVENLRGLSGYWGKIFFPLRLSVLPWPQDIGLVAPVVSLSVFLGVVIWGGIEDKRRFFFGALWFTAFLLPTVLRDSPYIHFLEHRLYLPFFGFLLMLLELKPVKRLAERKWLLVGISMLILLTLSVLTLKHSKDFKDPGAFWDNATTTSPGSYFGHQMLGRLYAQKGSWQEAESEYLKAADLRPDYALVYNDLGGLYERTFQLDKAESSYLGAIRSDPGNALYYNNLGNLYTGMNRPAEAESLLLRSLELNEHSPQAHANLALVYFKNKQYLRAKSELDRTAALMPGNPLVYEKLSLICIALDMKDSADYYHELAHRYDSKTIFEKE
jgi:tetratricopeptide (TPR) repeat protein